MAYWVAWPAYHISDGDRMCTNAISWLAKANRQDYLSDMEMAMVRAPNTMYRQISNISGPNPKT